MRPVLALALAAALPAAALAVPPGGAPPNCPVGDPQQLQLLREIAAIKLDQTLDLTADQARTLLPLVREAQQLRDRARQEFEREKPALLDALTAARDDLRRGGELSAPTRAALEKAYRAIRPEGLRPNARAARAQIRSVLTAEQLEKLRRFDPRPIAAPGPLPGALGPDADAPPPDAGRGKKLGRGHRSQGAFKAMLSPEFLSLLEKRAAAK